jgi:hypothetical protein
VSPRVRYLTTTLLLVATGLGYALIQARPWSPGPPLHAQPAAVSHTAPETPALPAAREILERRALLSLTRQQAARLEALDREWQKESGTLQRAVEARRQEFSSFITGAQSARGASVQEIQQRSADYRELSATLRERRRLHGDAAARVLTEGQRDMLARTPRSVNSGGER